MAGSSPRARGTVAGLSLHSRSLRFIPAGAGNRLASTPNRGANTVHPRGRGEQEHRKLSIILDAGSSPRARGTALKGKDYSLTYRFIPAGAGNRSGMTGPAPWRPVHPRGRGEQVGLTLNPGLHHGSSPRARGTEW